ncbi:MAG TPA: DNA topoisomerase IB [Chthoniobacterales bacterium]|jgi:DNA topoisomerase-1|nr:DNA topoisomerase IB [Chthoniobacterales bacterium]
MHARAKKGNGNDNASKLVAQSIEAAEEAGLRYISDDRAGYTRRKKGDDFEYVDTDGKPIRDEQRLLRLKRLAIPPAWTDVWICPSTNCHLQATGRDARRRKQYLYHERWREIRDEDKYDRMIAFGKALPKIRKRVSEDLKLPGLPRNKVLATVVQLLERTFIRIGNEEYARENKSFGLTTMKDRHVKVKGSKLRFRFRGKSGKDHEVDVRDRRIAKIISKLQDLPGQDLFQYVDDAGEVHNVSSQDVNAYLREITDEDFSAKDFRTLAGTVLTAAALSALEQFETKKQAKANLKTAIGAVSKILGNTPAICRKCYVHPAIFESYLGKRSIEGLKELTEDALEKEDVDLRASEKAVLKFLESRLTKKAA